MDTYTYTAYGAPLSATNNNPNPFRFGGQAGYYTDTNSVGLILCGARWYHPGLGRWLSRDPAGYDAGANLYAYCHGNSVGFLDPSGLCPGWVMSVFHGTLDVAAGMAAAEGGPLASALAVGLVDGLWAHYIDHKGVVDSAYEAAKGVGTTLAFAGAGKALGKVLECPAVSKFIKQFGCEGEGFIAALLRKLGISCFVAGTPVAVSGGGSSGAGSSEVHYKAIEDIRVNDVVVSRDVKTGKTENRKVVSLHKYLAQETITVALADPSGKVVQTLTATPEHPFYVEGRGMVSLSQIGIGTHIVTRAGPTLTVKSTIRENHSHGVYVYNFEVEGDHTYFVGTAGGGAWVHNDCVALGILEGKSAKVTQKGIDRITAHLSRLDHAPYNDSMIARLVGAMKSGKSISGADLAYYTHEL